MFIYDTASCYMLTYAPSISCSPKAASTSPSMHMHRDAHAHGTMDAHIEALHHPTCQSFQHHL